MVKAMRLSLERAFYGTASAPRVNHPGVLLDYYLREIQSGEKPALRDLYEMVCQTPAPALYHQAYERWRDLHAEDNQRTVIRQFDAAGRLVVGLGGESVRETGITLQHTYGVPVIPGSALKGLARAYLRWTFEQDPAFAEADYVTLHQTLFGEQDAASYFVWHDAWYIPGSAPGDRPLVLDVLTPHHRDYYTGGGGKRAWPTDFDAPTPVHFLSARGSYLVIVSGPDRAWAERSMELLARALADWGVGGKTSSGYGRLVAVSAGTSEVAQQPTAEPALIAQIRALSPASVPGQIYNLFQAARKLDAPARSAALHAIWHKLNTTPTTSRARWQEGKAWVQELKQEIGIEDDND